MSSTASPVSLHLAPRPSRRLRLALACVHGGAMLLVLLLPLSLLWRLDIVCLLGSSLAWYWPRLMRMPVVVWEGDGGWSWAGPDGATEALELQPDTLVTRWLVLLSFRTGSGARRYLVLPGDALDPTSLRRLRVRLRIEASAADQPRER